MQEIRQILKLKLKTQNSNTQILKNLKLKPLSIFECICLVQIHHNCTIIYIIFVYLILFNLKNCVKTYPLNVLEDEVNLLVASEGLFQINNKLTRFERIQHL